MTIRFRIYRHWSYTKQIYLYILKIEVMVFFFPISVFALLCSVLPTVVVTHIWGQIAGSPAPLPLWFVPFIGYRDKTSAIYFITRTGVDLRPPTQRALSS